MADLKISALNALAGADLVAADVVAVVDDSASETKKLTVSDLIANGTTLISDATIPSAKILFSAGAIDTAELAASAVETAKINDSAVTAAKLADNSSVTLVSTLPASGDFTGQIALDTDDDKIYVWDGSAWDSVKGAGSINVVNGSTTGEVNIVASTSGDTVTISATLDDTTAAAQFLAGPTGAGGTVGYRAIIGTDLPTASTTAKGGVIVNGNGLTMSSDTIAIDNTVTAETSENHIVQYDANGLVTGGRAIVAADVPNATSTTVGVIKPGSGLGVTAAGELNHDNSVTAGTASKVTFDTEGHITGTESLVAADIPDLDAAKITTGTVPTARIASDAITAAKLADKSTTTIAELTPSGGDFVGQGHLNSISGDFLIWDGNVWQPIGVSVGEIVLAGTYDASTNLMATVTSEGTSLSYVVGSALPAASASNKGYYVVVSEAGTGTSPAPTVALNPPDFLLSTGTAYTEIDVSSTVVAQVAENISFTAAGNIAATNVQAAIEELDTEKVAAASPSLTGTVSIGTGGTIQFEGATANDFESTLTVVDPTADRTLSLPDATGTLVSTGDTGTVTSTMIVDGTIVNADISASAEIAVSKLANGTARQLLQTDVAGSGVEFTSNVDVPGTLDVTGAATLDSTLAVTGATTVTGVINADGKVKFPAGSASAPSFYSGTDTNTGLYFSAADEISVATGGTQRVVVDSSGNVGIGTTSASSKLHVDHDINAEAYTIIENSRNYGFGVGIDFKQPFANAGSSIVGGRIRSDYESDNNSFFAFSTLESGTLGEKLRIDSAGNVGIGTTSPVSELHVEKATQAHISVKTASSNQAKFGSKGNDVYIAGTSGSTNVIFKSNVTSIDHPADSGTERMRIDSSGRLLVGTTSAIGSGGAELEVAKQTMTSSDMGLASFQLVSNSSRHPQVFLEKSRGSAVGDKDLVSDGDSLGELAFRGSDGTNYLTGASIIATVNGTPGTNDLPTDLRFSTTPDGGASSIERMRIDSSGQLLVGTSTAPSAQQIQAANTGGENLGVFRFANNTGASDIVLHKSRGSLGSHTIVQNNDAIGSVVFRGSDGSAFRNAATINGEVDGTPGSSDMPGRLVFSTTADGASSPTEAMRIDSKQRVTVKAGAIAEIDTLTSASTVTPDFATSCNFTLTLGTNVTLANPSNVTAGQSGSIFLVQDGTGSRTLTLGSSYDFAGGTAPTLSTAANAVDRLDYIVRTSTSIHCVVTLAYS